MKKDNIWKVTIDGEQYVVRCDTFKTVYDVYVDDDLAIRVGRDDSEDMYIEHDITIGGKVCQFVIYNGRPDLSVDGILQGVVARERRTDLRNRLLKFFGGIAVASVSSFAAFLWFVFDAAGEPIFGGIPALVCIFIFILGGLWLVASALLKKKPC